MLKNQWSALLFSALLAGGGGVLLLLPLSRPLQESMMRKFHLSESTRIEWCVLQLLPSMYNFKNTAQRVSEGAAGDESQNPDAIWLNHYPVRVLTFLLPQGNGNPRVMDFRSAYRGSVLRTRVRLESEGGGLKWIQEESRFVIP